MPKIKSSDVDYKKIPAGRSTLIGRATFELLKVVSFALLELQFVQEVTAKVILKQALGGKTCDGTED